ncbi:MAG: GvpL/GvpF family gas vesicle protein [Actinobacteria bacterium]|nr:GvpL/GvpF family gas vesicle protein [Actinomycetota bacterium]MCG2679383.1 GvpL/GvpF family gas vesicle protein [Kiritimatiellia bacterium]
MDKEGIYIYCIIGSSPPPSFGAPGIGERGDELYCVSADLPAEAAPQALQAGLSPVLPTPAIAGFAKAGAPGTKGDGLCAVVSRSPMQKFKMSRDNLLAHERAIEDVMKTHTVLPVRFATVAESEEKVRKILLKEAERFSSLLREMEGRKELGVKAIFNSEKIYAQIAEQKDIKQTRDRLAALPADKIYFQKMELGRMVEKALERERDKCRDEIMVVLTPLAIEVKTAKPYGELMILNGAFLVECKREEEFDGAFRALEERFGALITWRYIGTLPPFNFVNVEISTEDL